MRRRIICLLLAAVLLAAAMQVPSWAPQGYAFATAEDGTADQTEQQNNPIIPSPTDVVSGSDSEYFERVALVPANVEVPEFYKQVKNVAGMYIFTMPDGTVHKRIYGALSGEFGWYIPVGAKNIVPMDAEPINTWDDIEMYTEAMEQYTLDQAGKKQDFNGILPPEDKTSGVTDVFGYEITQVVVAAAVVVSTLCVVILIGSAIRKKTAARKNRD